MPMTRHLRSDSIHIKVGDLAWHKQGYILMLVRRTARGWRRERVIHPDILMRYIPDSTPLVEGIPLKGVFFIPPGTRFLSRKQAREHCKKAGFPLTGPGLE